MRSVYCYHCAMLHIRLLCLAADAGYINTDYIRFKIKQNTQTALRVIKSSQKSSEISVENYAEHIEQRTS